MLELAWASLRSRALSVGLTVLVITLSVVLLLGVERVRTQAHEGFASTVSGTDLIVGARSGPVNLLLYSVFHIGDPTNNVSWQSYQELSALPQVKWAVPLSLGDSWRGYRVVGTSDGYFEHYRYGAGHALAFADGRPFDDLYDVVIGAEVARATGLHRWPAGGGGGGDQCGGLRAGPVAAGGRQHCRARLGTGHLRPVDHPCLAGWPRAGVGGRRAGDQCGGWAGPGVARLPEHLGRWPFTGRLSMRWMLSLPMVLALVACERPVDTGVQALPPAPVVDRADAADAAEQELDWLQMMPKDELAALERGEGPEVEHNGNRRMPQFGTFRTVDTVLQRPVRLPGYVVPLANAQDGRLTEFLFVPYYGACIHVPPPPPNQIVHVVLPRPIDMPDMYSPFFLAGTLHAERLDDDLAGSAYTMRDAQLRPYEP